MTEITKATLHEYVVTGEFSIASETEGLRTTLLFVMDKTPVASIIASSLKDKRINKQVQLRAHPERFSQNQVIRIAYSGELYEDPRSAYDKYLSTLSPEAQAQELQAQIARLQALQAPAK